MAIDLASMANESVPGANKPISLLALHGRLNVWLRPGGLPQVLERKHLPGMLIEVIEDLRGHWQQIQARMHTCDQSK